MKNIWIVYPYGNVIDEDCREMRYVMFGKELSKNGYNVVWWTSNFSHTSKEYRCRSWGEQIVDANFKIILVPSKKYKKNISFGRVRFEQSFVKNLKKAFIKNEKPDLIITSGTGLFTAFRPIWPYAHKNMIPVIYDIMDVHMINEYFKEKKKILFPLVRVLTFLNELREKNFYKYVSAVSGLGSNQLEIAKKRTGNRNIPSCLVYNGIYVEEFRKHFWDGSPIDLPEKKENDIWIVYAGSLGPSYNIESVVKCADFFKNNSTIKFIIAGDGPQKDLLIKKQDELKNLIYLGSVKPEFLASIYKKCDIGLCPFASFSTVDMPDKFYDYCAAGLAVINSLTGEISRYINSYKVGINYYSKDNNGLLDSLKKIIFDRKLLLQYKSNSFELGPKFDMKNQLKSFVKIIEEVCPSEK